MATIRKRGRSWQVQIRLRGCRAVSRTFETKAEAVAWGRETERSVERIPPPIPLNEAVSLTVSDLLTRYVTTVTVMKRSKRSERSRIGTLLAHPIAQIQILTLKPCNIARYRDDRLKLVSGDAVRRELTILRHCLNLAMKEWDVSLSSNPFTSVSFPKASKARNTRLDEDAADRLHATTGITRAWYLRPIIDFALQTGMRRGEIVSLLWIDVSFNKRTAHLRDTKNGHPRTIPLTPKAIEILMTLPRTDGRVFPVSGNAIRLSWERLRIRAKLPKLRFHQLRHEAISRFFEQGLSVPEVALISGHRDLRTLQRYIHLRPEDLAEKLARLDE